MSELDLDALEKTVERAKAENFDSLAFSMDTVVIDRLIQRLREAEAEILALRGVAELEKAAAEKWKARRGGVN